MGKSKKNDKIIDKRQGNNIMRETTRSETPVRKRERPENRESREDSSTCSNKRRRERSSDSNSSDDATTARSRSSSDISSSEDERETDERYLREIVTLNVGGRKFTTLNITVKGIMNKMVQSGYELFIDRDSQLFPYILNYLRYQQQGETNPSRDLLPSDSRSLAALQLEAKYFNLPKLEKQCNDKRISVKENV